MAEVVATSACPLDCPDACSLEVKVEDGRVTALEGSHRNPTTAGFVCGKVRGFTRHLYGRERLLQPGLRKGPKGAGRFQPLSWDEALGLVAENLAATRNRHGGEAIVPMAYGGCNGAFTDKSVDHRLFRRLGATRLLRTVCAEATGRAAEGMTGKMPGVAMQDYVHARAIVVWGANPHASGIHHVPYLMKAREQGGRLAVVDPRRTKLARQADLHLALWPGTDLAVALALIRWLFETGRADEAFLAAHCTGAEELRRRAEPWTLDRAARVARVAPAEIEALGTLFADAEPAVVRCGWGLERNRNGGSAVCAVLALPAVAGKFGVRGGGYTLSNSGAIAWDLDAAAAEAEPRVRALNMNRLGEALLRWEDPPVRTLFVYNCNPLATLPNQEAVRRGLAREDLFTVVYDQVLTDTARHADVVLPATTFLEHHELRRSYGTMALQWSRPVIEPREGCRPNYQVFAELIQRLGLGRPGDPETPEALAVAALAGAPGGEALSAALEAVGFAPAPTGLEPIQFRDAWPRTRDRRMHLVPADLDEEAPRGLYHFQPDPGTRPHSLALISPSTTRTVSSTFGQLHRRQEPLELHPDTAAALGLADGDRIRAFNDLGEVHAFLRTNPDLLPGVACLPKGLWSHNTLNGNTANALCPDTLADLGGNACFNDARIQVEALPSP